MDFRGKVTRKIQKLFELTQKKSVPCVLMFHSVVRDIKNCYNQEYSISFNSYCNMVNALLNEGYRIVSPDTFFNSYSKKNVLLSLDDVYSNVYPFMLEKQLPYIVFQAYSFINKTCFLKDNQIEEMINSSIMTLGSHSLTHCSFADISNEQSMTELKLSKKLLEERFLHKIKYFAFPYGGLANIRYRDMINAKKCKYEHVFSTVSVGYKGKGYLIPRINVNESNYKVILKMLVSK